MTTASDIQQPDAAAVEASSEMLAYRRQAQRRLWLGRGATLLVGLFLAAWILVPVWFISSMALTTPAEVRAYPKGVLPFIPFSLDTLLFFLRSHGVVSGLINSIVVASITLVLSTLIAAPAGYAISRYAFRGRDTYRLGVLAVRAFPIVVLAIPLAVLFLNMGIYDSVFSLGLMHTALTLPTSILIIGSVFASVPYELQEAAMMFGCTPFQAFRRVALPLALPGIAAAALFTFVMSWNEVFAASILTVRNRTLPAQVLSTLGQSSEPYQFAGAFFMLIPSIIFIFVIRNYLFNMWGQISK
jgi:multiple sugar transport system permease protein